MRTITLALLLALFCAATFAKHHRGFRGGDDGYDGGDDGYGDGGDYPDDGYDGSGDDSGDNGKHHSRHHKKHHKHHDDSGDNGDGGNGGDNGDGSEGNNEQDISSTKSQTNDDATTAAPVSIPATTSSQVTAGTVTRTTTHSGTIIYGTAPAKAKAAPVAKTTDDASADATSTDDASADATSTDDASADATSTDDASADATSTDNAPAAKSSSASSNVDSFAQECLNIHNDERASLGIQAMTWSDDLAQAAKSWAQELADEDTLKHSDNRVHIGENVGRRKHKDNQDNVALLIGAWLDEKKDFENGDYPDISTTGNVHDVGHYSQMIWSTSIELGCAMANGGGRDYMVCQYGPSGNRQGKPVY